MLQKPDVKTHNILKMAEFFETLSITKYNQKHFEDSNGRKCICGWTNYLNNVLPENKEQARLYLGLRHSQMLELFRCDPPVRATPKIAARVLRHLAVTGEVNWSI